MIYPLLIFIFVTILAINLYYFEFVRGSDKTYFVSDEAANWTDAKQACREAGMELASVLNEKERVSLEKFIERYKLTPSDKWTGYWLSGIRYPNGTFIWDTTGTQVGEEVNNWQLGEPSNGNSKEHCIELKIVDEHLGWNDYFCDENRRYICQYIQKERPHGQDLDDYSFLKRDFYYSYLESN
ncbi:salivary C-type lectin 2-like [Rhynchophorus ferrugineus]|uniref:salivary C-type lectin 2-like n=1 Tax=Rhynchophorus ferrugineus TaxID=354439 RepID=UPI003FCD5EA5